MAAMVPLRISEPGRRRVSVEPGMPADCAITVWSNPLHLPGEFSSSSNRSSNRILPPGTLNNWRPAYQKITHGESAKRITPLTSTASQKCGVITGVAH